MSTGFCGRSTKEQMVRDAMANGWVEGKASNGWDALISPNGHYAHALEERVGPDGSTLAFFTRYGENHDCYDLAEELGFISEHNDEWAGLVYGEEQEIDPDEVG